ncbi:MAG: glycosyl hydrolase [bacterium]
MKQSNAVLSCILILLAIVPACQKQEVQDSYTKVLEAFQNPPAEFRSVPLWVWNDRVTTAQIEEQLKDFKDKGIGGVFIHPRPGLITPYLSEEWLSLCRHTVKTAKNLGMKVWIYDENSYPSGFAGGHVPDQMHDAVRKSLVMKKVSNLPETFESDPFLVLQKMGKGFTDITELIKTRSFATGEYYLFEFGEQAPSPWYGGFTYVDIMRKDVTQKFLEVTMDAYKRVIGEEFGKTVPGVFQDEAHIAPAVGGKSLSYTPALFEMFEKIWGYDLKLHLPSLIEETGDWRKVRYDYYATLNHLFIEGWAKPYSEYCAANNLHFTGHYWEHDWPRPRLVQDNMAMAAYAHMPGIDILMNVWSTNPDAQFGNARSVKEIRSVANQMGYKRTMSETFGAGGWDMTFFDQKRIGDWEYVLGVNFLNQHLSYITIKGARKRDHPLSFSYHEPWWHAYGILGNYFARLSVAMSRGEQQNSILVLEPTTSAWMYYSPIQSGGRMQEVGKDFQNFVHELESRQVEYDLGSESILRDHGSVSGEMLVVGERVYSLVVLPPGFENLNKETLALLENYLRHGGRILSCVEPPRFVGGLESEEPALMASTFKDNWKSAIDDNCWEMLGTLCPPALEFSNTDRIGGILFHHRRVLKDAELVFLVNSSPVEEASGRFTSVAEGSTPYRSCETWNSFTGAVGSYPSRYESGKLIVDFKIHAGGSLLLCLRSKDAERSAAQEKTETQIQAEERLSIRPLSPNVLTLDYCDLTLAGKTERDLYFYDAQRKTFQHNGLDRNPWDSAVQFKTNIIDKDHFGDDSGFEVNYRFEASDGVNLENLNCVIERPDLYRVYCNGTEIKPEKGKWWLDKVFAVFNIDRLAKHGKNQITLIAQPFTIHTELEAVYVLGDFDLENREKGFRLVPPKDKKLGSWKAQGMPFYAGGVAYEKEFHIPSIEEGGKLYIVRLGKWFGAVAEVFINGESAGFIAFNPLELDVSEKLREGSNRIRVVVYGTLKNTLGPHHNNPGLGTAWPGHFQRGAEGGRPSGSKYSIVDYGLFEDFSVILRK